MSEDPYTKRELDEKIEGIHTQLDRIEIQTTKTNGRVSRNTAWINMMIGAISILTVVVIPILGWALIQLVNLPTEINTAITQELQNYDISVQK